MYTYILYTNISFGFIIPVDRSVCDSQFKEKQITCNFILRMRNVFITLFIIFFFLQHVYNNNMKYPTLSLLSSGPFFFFCVIRTRHIYTKRLIIISRKMCF